MWESHIYQGYAQKAKDHAQFSVHIVSWADYQQVERFGSTAFRTVRRHNELKASHAGITNAQ